MAVPSTRFAAATGYHTGQTKLVLFGGRNATFGDQVLGDTWLWSAGAWTQVSPANSPPARYSAAMGYIATGTKIVLFGGKSPTGVAQTFGDTWTFDGISVWTQLSPAGANPPARHHASMGVDSTGQLVLFGGYGGPNGDISLGDTWGFNGTVWTLLA